MPTIKENTAKLTPTKGAELEAKGEGGEIVDTKTSKNSYLFECEVFVKKGDARPIEDEDGLIADNYSIRLTPEDSEAEGFALDKCSVSVEESWTSADGKMLKYSFKALTPAEGKMCKPYMALAIAPKTLSFASAADATGKTATVTATGTVAAVSDQTWATVTVAAKVVTVKVTANTGAARTANVTVAADGKSAVVVVSQAAGV